MFTHLATAESDPAYATFQYQSYRKMEQLLAEKDVTFKYRHMCNSAGMILYPEMQMNLVRPGITQYGSYPTEAFKKILPLKPVMNLYSHGFRLERSHRIQASAMVCVGNRRTRAV